MTSYMIVARMQAVGVNAGADRRTVMILSSLVSFVPLAIDTYLPALPTLSRDLEASTAAAQLTLTGCLVGLATGQLLAGPLSDALGRRRPLLLGVAGFAVMSVLCALATTVWALVALRFVQGVAGGAGVVIANAIVRDRHQGVAAVRVFGLMAIVSGIAPILAPLVGALVLEVTSWRAIFLLLGAFGVSMFTAALIGLPESLPHTRRRGGGLGATASVFRTLARDRGFVACMLALALPAGALFAYIAGSPFVLQDIYGLSPTGFSIVFAVNSVGIVGASVLSNLLVERVGPGRLLVSSLVAGCVGGAALVLAVMTDAGLAGVLPALFVVVATIGLGFPNATGLALERHPDAAGSAAALLGVLPFLAGAAAAPLVGVAGATSAVPLAVVIAVLEAAALGQYVVLTRAANDGP